MTDQCSGARPLFRYSRSPPFDATFRSPAAITSLTASLRSQVNVPGLHLHGAFAALLRLVRLRAPDLVQLFVAAQGAFNARNPLPNPATKLSAGRRISAPLQDLSILPAR